MSGLPWKRCYLGVRITLLGMLLGHVRYKGRDAALVFMLPWDATWRVCLSCYLSVWVIPERMLPEFPGYPERDAT